jgi:hypothetical protein
MSPLSVSCSTQAITLIAAEHYKRKKNSLEKKSPDGGAVDGTDIDPTVSPSSIDDYVRETKSGLLAYGCAPFSSSSLLTEAMVKVPLRAMAASFVAHPDAGEFGVSVSFHANASKHLRNK